MITCKNKLPLKLESAKRVLSILQSGTVTYYELRKMGYRNPSGALYDINRVGYMIMERPKDVTNHYAGIELTLWDFERDMAPLLFPVPETIKTRLQHGRPQK